MQNLQINILRILNGHYKSKTEKVSREIFEEVKGDFDNEIKFYIKNMTREQMWKTWLGKPNEKVLRQIPQPNSKKTMPTFKSSCWPLTYGDILK